MLIDEYTRRYPGDPLPTDKVNNLLNPASVRSALRDRATAFAVRRERLWNEIHTEYPAFVSATGGPRIRSMIDRLELNELTDTLSASSRRQRLMELFPDYHDFDVKPNLNTLFSEISLLSDTPENQERKNLLKKIHSDYAQF
jgi:hypothetical protein